MGGHTSQLSALGWATRWTTLWFPLPHSPGAWQESWPSSCTSGGPHPAAHPFKSPENALEEMETQAAGGHTIWSQPHEVYPKKGSTICMAGLGSTSFLSLTPFSNRTKESAARCTLVRRQSASTRGGHVGTSCWAVAPVPTRASWAVAGEASLGREEAPGARGISDETGQAITDRTCRNASLSRRAPGRPPMNWPSLARGPAPREEGVWPQPFPSMWGCLPGTRARTWVGLVCGQHLFNPCTCVKKEL